MGLNMCAVFEPIKRDGDPANYDDGLILPLQVEGLGVILIVNHVVLSGPICVLGIVFNVINIVVFLKQGISNTVNISMFAIAVSDLCGLVTLEWININLNPFMENAKISYEPYEIQLMTGGWPHGSFLQITTSVTVYVTAERFVCIALPLKVKQIFTPLRTKVAISLTYLIVLLALASQYGFYYFEVKFYPARNESRVGTSKLSLARDNQYFEDMMYPLTMVMAFILLTTFTSLLVVALKRRSHWRGSNSRSFSRRDSKTVKMVCVVSASLITCTTPMMCLCVAGFCVPGFTRKRKYINYRRITISFAYLLEAINLTANTFFFYQMSSNYRTIIRRLLCLEKSSTGVSRAVSR